MGYEFVTGEGLPLSTRPLLGKNRKNSMDIGTRNDVKRLREVEQLWAALWLSAELREVRERSLQVDAAVRA
jgi:hypothetical protein